MIVPNHTFFWFISSSEQQKSCMYMKVCSNALTRLFSLVGLLPEAEVCLLLLHVRARVVLPPGLIPALTCAPNRQVAECLALLLTSMYPNATCFTLNSNNNRINPNTFTLGESP